VGGHKTINVNVRVIAATNKNLQQEMKKGNFREDLFYRLNVFPLNLPPLRYRKEDIPPLLEEFTSQLSQEHNFKPLSFSSDAISILQKHPWPGNVRELKNFVERMYILHQGREISASMLPAEIRDTAVSGQGPDESVPDIPDTMPHDFKQARSMFEARFLDQKLKEHAGNVSRLAESIGLERSYLYRKLKTYNISTD